MQVSVTSALENPCAHTDAEEMEQLRLLSKKEEKENLALKGRKCVSAANLSSKPHASFIHYTIYRLTRYRKLSGQLTA